ncbi:SGNH/GDSL hydrolase family protein [Streptomyces sp. TRM 70351]|nr:SGNH/GDSL hydrolase family protein [Streptomyces sp. TRM 70351]MEE1926904.1 SGNH/GDSL hydrolase family protein [Streptomyces sp. TRM 70351]
MRGPVAVPQALPLARHFDNRGVSDDADPAAADFDGAGNSFSAQDLRAAGWTPGRTLDLDGAPLRAPRAAPGAPDNVRADGQHVALRGTGGPLSFLVAASSPSGAAREATGHGTVHYSDGSTARYTLTAGDWRGGPLATKAVALPHRNTPAGQRTERTRLYAVTVPVPVREGAEVRSVQLPADPGPDADLHVFDAAWHSGTSGWTGTWATSTGGYRAVGPWKDRTLRLVVHASAGGTTARVRLANTFAAAPVEIAAASVAVRRSGAQAVSAPVPLSFGERPGVRIPAGARAVSDPVDFTVPAGGDLLVSLHLPGTVTAAPVNTFAMQRSYASADGAGDLTRATGATGYRAELTSWPFLTGVDVAGGPGSVVTLGDSITAGEDSTVGANRRWPDVLAERLRAGGVSGVPAYGVLNHGISANRIVTDRYPGDGVSNDAGGVSAQHRLERDVLAQPGVRTVVLFEGVNDLRAGTSAQDVIAGMRAIAERSRARGLRVVGATVSPCGGWPDCTAAMDRERRTVNAFVRDNGGVFDAVLDFDAVLRDPAAPHRLLPAYDSGDHLHPGDAGLRAVAHSVDLRLLVPPGR